MPDPLPGRSPPFEVGVGVHPFLDHRFIHAGQPRWVGTDGAPIHYWESTDPAQVRAAHASVPRGVQLRVQPAERTAPFLDSTEPWEHLTGGPTIIRDGGLYRMWYHALPPDHWDQTAAGRWGPDFGGFLCYAESHDGFDWRKPALGQYQWQGRGDTNVVLGRELAGAPGLHGESVFLDPQAPAHERYKALYMGRASPDVVRRWMRERPAQVDPWSSVYPDRGVFVAVSPDGIRWTPHPDPVVIFISDTQNVVDWNPQRQSYVWYARGWAWDRRTIARAETRDFFDWPLPTPALTEPPAGAPVTDIYTNGKVTYPGDPGTHVMFPTLYDRARDTTSIAVAASADDLAWAWVPGGPALEPGPEGAFDGGCVFAAKGLVELPGHRIGVPYSGNDLPHKFPRRTLRAASAYAVWPRGRIAGVTASSDGEFATPPLLLHGCGLRLDLQTAADGHVRVTALERAPGWTPRPGHGALTVLAESQPLHGNHLRAPVSWTNGAALRPAAHGPIVLRFQLRRATLYGFELTA